MTDGRLSTDTAPLSPSAQSGHDRPADRPRPHAVCVYCGAADGLSGRYKEEAARLGTVLGRHRIDLIYGGGLLGLMGVTADATLAAGGRVTGIIPDHMKAREIDHPGLTELIVVESMHARKRLMVDRSDAFVVLPGGIGTLDETFEILSWRQLGLHDKPIILVNVDGFWEPLLGLLDRIRDEGFVRRDARSLFTLVANVDAVLPALRAARYPESAAETGLM